MPWPLKAALRHYSRAERAAFALRVEEARKQAEAEHHARQAEATKRAAAIWKAATPAPDNHPYLIQKRIHLHDARIDEGALTLPVIDCTGTLTSLQFIAADGGKWLLSGGRKRSCFIPVVGDMENPTRIIICEGWATGCTLAEDESAALVLAAIDAGNLEPVALAARHRRTRGGKATLTSSEQRSLCGVARLRPSHRGADASGP